MNDMDSLELFLSDVRRGPRLLTREEEVALAKRIERGDLAAKERMINSNLRLCVANARRWRGQGLDLLDLIQEATIGLVRAVERFDWRRGFRFSTFATPHIRAALQKAVVTTGRTVRLPPHVEQQRRRLEKAQELLWASTGKAAAADMIAAAGVDLTPDDVALIRRAAAAVTSLDAAIRDEDDAPALIDLQTNHDAVDPAHEAVENVEVQALRAALDQLSYRPRRVIVMRRGLGERARTLDEIAAIFGVQREQIRLMQLRAEKRLAELAEAEGLAA